MKYDIKKIIQLINKNGRQGPKDLKSREVFEWVKSDIDIPYEEYVRILNENSIKEADRKNNRNAFFVVDSRGKTQLFKSNEEEIRSYICYIVRENPEITSGEAREKFKVIYQGYTIVDLMDQMNLTSHQDIIDQTIRNILVSNYYKKKNNILFYRSEEKPYKYTLKEKGFLLAQEIEDKLSNVKQENEEYEFENDTIETFKISKGLALYTDEELKKIEENNKNFNLIDYIDEDKISSSKNRFPTDPKIRATRFSKVSYKCECNSEHITFPTVSMDNYLEGHHLVPMAAQRNFRRTKLDCIENMVALCPICHSQIHYGTKEARKEVFDAIVGKRLSDLRNIGFTKEILNVIFDTYY